MNRHAKHAAEYPIGARKGAAENNATNANRSS
jgi:hypothetical protein